MICVQVESVKRRKAEGDSRWKLPDTFSEGKVNLDPKIISC